MLLSFCDFTHDSKDNHRSFGTLLSKRRRSFLAVWHFEGQASFVGVLGEISYFIHSKADKNESSTTAADFAGAKWRASCTTRYTRRSCWRRGRRAKGWVARCNGRGHC